RTRSINVSKPWRLGGPDAIFSKDNLAGRGLVLVMAAMTIVGSLFQNPSHDPAGLLFRSMKCTFLEYAIANTKKSSNFLSSSFIKEGSKATCRRCFWLTPSLLTKNFKLSEK